MRAVDAASSKAPVAYSDPLDILASREGFHVHVRSGAGVQRIAERNAWRAFWVNEPVIADGTLMAFARRVHRVVSVIITRPEKSQLRLDEQLVHSRCADPRNTLLAEAASDGNTAKSLQLTPSRLKILVRVGLTNYPSC